MFTSRVLDGATVFKGSNTPTPLAEYITMIYSLLMRSKVSGQGCVEADRERETRWTTCADECRKNVKGRRVKGHSEADIQ